MQTFPATTTWTCPAGVTSIAVECWGGGGAGGAATGNPAAGGGGGGGSYVKNTAINVTPGTVYTVTVGTGGIGNTGAGANGNDSWFSDVTTILAKGGNGGLLALSNNQAASGGLALTTGNVGATAPFSYYGGAGGTGVASGGSSGAGGSSAGTGSNGNNATGITAGAAVTGGGAGVNGVSGNNAGNDNTNLGGGGSGGHAGSTTDRDGGNGGNGQVKISYTTPLTYKSQLISYTLGSTTWCPAETRTITVVIKNIGTATWVDAPRQDINVGLKWNSNNPNWLDYHVRQDVGNITPGNQGTYIFSITASNNAGSGYTTPLATGINNLTADVVYEGVSWFGDNGGGVGPGNTKVPSANQTIAVPTAFNVTGGGAYCNGGTGVSVGLSNSTTTVNYQLYNGAVTVGAPVAGTGAAISFGLQTAAGTYTVVATTAAGCSNTMTGTATVTITPTPNTTFTYASYSYCKTGTSPAAILSGSPTTGTFSATPAGLSFSSTTTGAINLASSTAGSYSITYTVAASGGCGIYTYTQPTNVVINALPTLFTVGGAASYCSTTGGTVTLSGSQVGVNYQLYNGAATVGAAVAGTGAGLSFTALAASGTYTIIGTNPTTSCSSLMTGSAAVTVTPTPNTTFTYASYSYCKTGTSPAAILSGSPATGTFSATPAGLSFSSTTTGAINLASSTAGSYSITYTVAASGGCGIYTYVQPTNIVINALPTLFTVGGTNSYCSTTGGTVTLSGSQVGVNYQLYNGAATVGAAVAGTGAGLSFTALAASGTYTITGTNPTTTCSSLMTGSAAVTVTPTPNTTFTYASYNYCKTGTSPAAILSGSPTTGTFSATPAGLSFSSATSGAINLASSTAGSYSITYTVAATGGCGIYTYTQPTNVVINALPAVNAGADITTCTGTAAFSMAGATATGSVGTITWSGGAGLGTFSGTGTDPSTYVFTPSVPQGSFTATLTATVASPCSGANVTDTRIISWGSAGSWLGVTSTNWFTASNWCGGVPLATTDVTIPAIGSVLNQPSIGATTAVCRNITINGSLTMSGAFNLDVNGDWTNNGTFTPSTSSITFKGAGNNVMSGSATTTFYNLLLNKSATANTITSTTKAFNATNLTVTQGDLILQAVDADYTVVNDVNVPVNGILTHSVDWDVAGKLLKVSGSIFIDGIFNYTVRSHVSMVSAATETVRTGANAASGFSILTLQNGIFNTNGPLKINDNFWAMFGTAGSFHTNGQTVTANSGLLNSGGTVFVDGGTLNVTGGISVGAGLAGTLNFSAGTINSDGITVGTANTGTLLHSNSTTNNINGDLLLTTTGVYTCSGSPAINIKGNWTNNKATTGFTAANSQVNFNGTSPQALGGSFATTFNNLSIANAAGLTMGANASVNNVLNLSSGLITTSANTITVAAAGNITGASASSYVNGRLARIYSTTGLKVFPVGKGGNYRPVTFAYSALTGTSTVTIEQFEAALTGTLPANVTEYPARYWDITQNGGTGLNYTVTLDATGYASPAGVVTILKKELGTITSNDATIPNYTNATGFTTFAGTNNGTNSFALGADCSSTVDAGTALTDICQGGTSDPLGASIVKGTATAGMWSTTAGGTFTPNATTFNATWTPPAAYIGTATLVFTATNSLCGSPSDSKPQVVNPLPTGLLTTPLLSVCTGATVVFTATTGYNSYIFKVGGVTKQTGTSNTFSTNTLPVGTSSVTVDVANGFNCGATFAPVSIAVNPLPTPVLTVTENSGIPNNNAICPNAPLTLTAPLNAGSTYSFIINGTTVSTGSSNTYTTTAIAANATVAVMETNSNGCQATTAIQNITVNPVPSGTLSPSTVTICAGTSVTFTASGSFTTYEFFVNGVSKQGPNAAASYTTTTLNNGEIVSVIATNSSGCSTTFNPVPVTVNPLPTGTFTASENSGTVNDNSICASAPVTFAFDAGYSNYNFKVNGVTKQSGASNSYINTTLVNGNIVTIVVTSGSGCMATFTAPAITIVPSPSGTLIASLSTICAGSNVTFTATADPTFTNYNFQVNGTTVQNGSSNTFSSTSIADGDMVTVDVTNTNSCVTTFNVITMNVNPLPNTSFNISEASGVMNDDGIICAGGSVTFTVPATYNNYNFIVNNISQQSGPLNTYTTTTLVNGDVVTVAATTSAGCIGFLTNSYTITVNPLPVVQPIAGTLSICRGSSTTLTDATGPGTWSSQNTAVATVNASGVVTGMNAGTAVIIYTFTDGNSCSNSVSATVTVNAPPTVASIMGNFNVCTGSTSQMSNITPGGTWSSLPAGVASIDPTGLVTGVSPGAATVLYSVTDGNGCTTIVSVNITVSDLPVVAPITPGSPNVCITGSVALADATPGGTWSSSNTTVATVSTTGVVSGLVAGTSIISYSITTSCGQMASSSTTVTVNTPPSATIAYGGPFCTSAGPVSVTQTGTGGGTYSYTGGPGTLSLATDGTINPSASTAGNYTVIYTIVASGGCATYTTTTSVTITTAPSATITYAGGPSFCTSSAAIAVTRTGTAGGGYSSTAGLSIDPVTGTITPATSTAATYTVTYTILASGGCATYTTTTLVTITTAPAATISYVGAPNYCTSAATVGVTQTGTSGGTYSYTGGPGTLSLAANGTINPGASTPGTYTVIYTINASGGCPVFTATAAVTINPLPTVFSVTGGGTYCSGGTGVVIGLGNSETGVNYQLKIGGVNTGSPVAGTTGSAISFGLQTAAGNYTVVATNASTSCTSNMAGSATVSVTPAPTITSATPSPATVCPGSPSTLTVAVPAGTPATIVNYDFNSGASFAALSPVLAPGITSIVTSTVSFGTATGNVTTATAPAAFTTNSTVGLALSSPQANSWTFTLGGASLPFYKTFKVYAQAVRGSGGANTITLSYALNGSSTFVTAGVTSGIWNLASNGVWVANIASLPAAADNPITSIAFRLTIAGGAGTPEQLDNFQVQAVPSNMYSWTASPSGASAGLPVAASTPSFTNSNITVNPTVTTTYTVTGTNIAGCSSTKTATVNVYAVPAVTITANYCVVAGKVQLTANTTPAGTYTYQWLEAGVAITGATTSVINVDIADLYTVKVTTTNGCTVSDSISVAQELVVNGDFSAGNSGFFTEYGYTADIAGNTELYPEGLYGVGTSGQNYHDQFFGKEHSTIAQTGNFMLVNGSTTLVGSPARQRIIWEETVSVLPNTKYYFSAWGMNLNPASPAQLQFEVNGVPVGTIADLNIAPKPNSNGTVNINNWVRFYSNPNWTSGSTTTTAVIRIINLNTIAGGNDFGLDDISFGTLSTFLLLESAPGTDAQTICVNTPLTNIVYSFGNGNSNPTVSGLPAGVTPSFAGEFLTISGTPNVAGNYTYSITTTGCNPYTVTGTITVQDQKITLSSGSSSPSVCVNTPVNIGYTLGGTATGATATGLAAAGLTLTVSGTTTITATITGTPTVAGLYPYSITTSGTCPGSAVTINGTITVTSQTITLNSANDVQTACINTPISNIQYTIVGSTGATVTGLPPGVSGSYASGLFIISGTPTSSAGSPYSYTVTTATGPTYCAAVTATGIITVTPAATLTLTSGAGTNPQTVCKGTAIIPITYNVTNATSVTVSGLPATVTGSLSAGVFTISGTPNVSGTFNYTINASGGCGIATTTGVLTVQAQTITLTSGIASPSVCLSTPMADIVYTIGGTAGGVTVTGLPAAGVVYSISGNVITINGTPTTAGPLPYSITTTGTTCGPVSLNGTITIQPAAIGGTLTSVSSCSVTSGSLTLSGKSGNVIRWESSINGGGTWNPILNTTITQPYTIVPSGTMYRVVVNNGCADVYSTIATVGLHNYWTGNTNTDWNTASNWSDNQVPSTSCPTVTIPNVSATTNRYPVLSTGAVATITNLDIQANASLTVTGNTMQIAGSITNSGTFIASNGTIELNGSTPQTVPANTFQGNALNNLIISNTNTTTGVTLGGALNVYGSLTYSASGKILNTGGMLTLKSNATNTAWIGNMTGHTINGDVTVERYIGVGNLHPKSWQLLAIPTSGGQTINQAWQDTATSSNQNRYPGYGTQITGATGVSVDLPVTSTPSMKTWVPGGSTYVGISGTGIPIYNKKGYFIFVRGDRSVNAFNIIATTPTVLRTKGTLFTPANPPLITNVGVGQFESVGNPYASALDIRQISKTAGVDEFIYVWDPYLGSSGPTSPYGLGGFVTLLRDINGHYYATPQTATYDGGIHDTLQSGQAFFVFASGGGTVSFDENSKISGDRLVNSPVSNPQIVQQLRTNLYGVNPDGSRFMTDGTLNQFSSNYSNGIDGKDARKNANTSGNLSIKASGSLLAIERRQMVSQQDTIFLNLTGVRAQPYRYEFIAQNMNVEGLQGFVEDTYLHTRTPMDLNGTTIIDFTIVNVPGSYAANRFRIVFTPSVALPVTFTSVKAYRQAANINVEWKVENERNIKNYDVEKSADGLNFKTMVTKAATGNGGNSANYLAADAQPVTGYNYYRIRSNDQDGKTQLTKVVRVLVGTIRQDISIYPNPITDGTIHLQFMNEPEGKYKIRLLNKIGQVILSKEVTRTDGSSTELIKWDFNLAHGMYQLEITKPDGSAKNINVMY